MYAAPTLFKGCCLAAMVLLLGEGTSWAEQGTVRIQGLAGKVSIRLPGQKQVRALTSPRSVPHGTWLRTEKDSRAELIYPDQTKVRVRAESTVVLRATEDPGKVSGVLLYFGRIWTQVVRRVRGQASFEVRSANAVAGVRGTEFEVGVAADGATKVVVSEGLVAVGADGSQSAIPIAKGFEIDAEAQGSLGTKRAYQGRVDWGAWFRKRARALQKRGVKVAKNLEGRLLRRKTKYEALLKEQTIISRQIMRLSRLPRRSPAQARQLQELLQRSSAITLRLEDMQTRLQAAFGLFARWDELNQQGLIVEGGQMGKITGRMSRMARDFADLIEEGTDQSQEGMEDMLDEMKKGSTLKPKQSAKDELF